jgi:hypothetical protein
MEMWRFVFNLSLLIALIIGVTSGWYFGVVTFLAASGLLFLVSRLARCPRCGLVWPHRHELDTLVCSRCRLDIRRGLRE